MKTLLIVFALVGFSWFAYSSISTQDDRVSRPVTSSTRKGEVVNQVKLAYEEEGAKVPFDQILQGCPALDCIPSIDEPTFENQQAADQWLLSDDRVFVLRLDNISRIYPQKIMNWHEIVNDWFADVPVAVTFCPLCGSAVAFERVVDGTITEFGVSGKLHNNDLIMYDRLEGSGWQQITGEAIFGPAARRGESLTPKLLQIMSWEKAKDRYPNAKVLTRESAGYSLDRYDQYPYGTYEEDGRILFGGGEDARLDPKEWVYGISVNEIAKAYQEDVIIESSPIIDTLGDTTITITHNNGEVNVETDAGEELIPLRLFWFAWSSFNPATLLYTPS